MTEKHIYTVSELTQYIKVILEDAFPSVWVEGEVTDYKGRHSSGHIYFSIKDERSQMRVVIFKQDAQDIKFDITNGLAVLCFGRLSVYERQGQYQLYISKIEPKGVGALQLKFEQLKEKLRKEGLFDGAHKRPLPFLPRRIGIVTSPTGAAIRDMLHVLAKRFANIEVIINPVRVQGEGAAAEIAQAIGDFNKFSDIDVMIVGRGGGSIEDLWAFNEERLARAIYNSKIPVISAVGHEVDYTIADFVADVRAATPSVAAEMVVKKKEDLLVALEAMYNNLKKALLNKLELLKDELADFAGARVFREPLALVYEYQQSLDALVEELYMRASHILSMNKERLATIIGKLDALSPLAVLSRGYSITLALPEETVVRDAAKLRRGDRVKTMVVKGSFVSRVEETGGSDGRYKV